MITSDGWLVGDGIKIPANCLKFEIKKNGDVVYYNFHGDEAKKIGHIPLIRFENPDGMERTDMNRLIPSEDAGRAYMVKDHDCFKQACLERGNVSVYESANELLRLNASMLASMQILKAADQMYNKAINIREA